MRMSGLCKVGMSAFMDGRGPHGISNEVVFTDHPSQFPEGKEWKDHTKFEHRVPIQELFAPFFDDVKGQQKQAKQKRLRHCRATQWQGFVLLAKMCVYPNENDLGKHESADQRSAIDAVRNVKRVSQNPLR